MSLISEQIKDLKEYIDLYKHKSKGTVEVLENAVETIETLSAKLRGNNLHDGWIPVEDGLPKEDGFFLCWYEYRIMNGTHIGEITSTYGIGWCFNQKFLGGDVVKGERARVIAYMPLPEPYKGE